jgi:hypothetical protein
MLKECGLGGRTTLILRIFTLIRYGVAPNLPLQGNSLYNQTTKDTPDEKDSSIGR